MCNSKLPTYCREVEGLCAVCTHEASAASSETTPQTQSAETRIGGKEDGLIHQTLASDLVKQLEGLKPASLGLIRRKVALSDVEDIWQDACIEVVKSINILPDEQKLAAWFRTIVSRQIHAFYQGKPQSSQVRQLSESASLTSLYYEPERAFEEAQLREDIEQAIEKLGDKSRRVFRLYYRHGLTTPQIAKRLDENVPTIQSRLGRAKKKIRKELVELGHKPRQ